MNEQRKRVVAIGEVMVEMARGSDGRFGMGCGGDTFNTAVYLARAGIEVAYATALGDDSYSDGIVSLTSAEGIKTDLMLRVPGREAGLYLIETDNKGERRFTYWRENAPARELFELPQWGQIAEAMLSARLIYFSGITLSLYSNNGLGRFLAILEMARQQGVKVAFDGNFRPRGWKGDLGAHPHRVHRGAQARRHRAADLRRRGGAVGRPEPGGDGRAAAGVRHRRDRGEERTEQRAGCRRRPPGIRAAAGGRGAGRHHRGGRQLQRRLSWRRGSSGEDPAAAATAAHRLAGEKIRHRGAIMPRTAAAMH